MSVGLTRQTIAFAVLAATAFATALELNSCQVRRAASGATPIDPLFGDLEGCRQLGHDGLKHLQCMAAWAKNRERFFAPERPRVDPPSEFVPETSKLQLSVKPETRPRPPSSEARE
jgi:conjugative transfer region protein TrbK